MEAVRTLEKLTPQGFCPQRHQAWWEQVETIH